MIRSEVGNTRLFYLIKIKSLARATSTVKTVTDAYIFLLMQFRFKTFPKIIKPMS